MCQIADSSTVETNLEVMRCDKVPILTLSIDIIHNAYFPQRIIYIDISNIEIKVLKVRRSQRQRNILLKLLTPPPYLKYLKSRKELLL